MTMPHEPAPLSKEQLSNLRIRRLKVTVTDAWLKELVALTERCNPLRWIFEPESASEELIYALDPATVKAMAKALLDAREAISKSHVFLKHQVNGLYIVYEQCNQYPCCLVNGIAPVADLKASQP